MFKCTAVNARPAATLEYTLNPSIASIVFNTATAADPVNSMTDTSSSLMFMVSWFSTNKNKK